MAAHLAAADPPETGPLTAAVLPIRKGEIALFLEQVPGGRRLAASARSGGVHGYALTLSLPCWFDQLLGNAVQRALVSEIQFVQAHLLVHLQRVDDRIDGQAQLGSDGARPALVRARKRLRRLFGPADPFWARFAALSAEQAASVRWEVTGRRGRLPPFDDVFVRRLASKAAILRWPAGALASLAGKPERAAALDDLAVRMLGVFLLLDDLADFEEDAARGQLNAVLCAARSRSVPEPVALARAVRVVCAKGRSELARLRRAGPRGSFQRTCDHLAKTFGEMETSIATRCYLRALSGLCAQLAR